MVAHTCNFSTQEAEEGGSGGQGQFLATASTTSLGYMTPCFHALTLYLP